MIVAPTEPKKLRDHAGKVSMVPERYGCDVLWTANGVMVGVQRKEFADLVASVADGRLGMQLDQMAGILDAGGVTAVVVEGDGQWTGEGQWAGRGSGLSVAQYRGVMWSVQSKGVWWGQTRDLDGTIGWLGEFERWTGKARHRGLSKRESPRNQWGVAGNRDFERHLLQGFPGIGYELADRILDQVGMPFVMTAEMEEKLAGVKGMGAKKITAMRKALGVRGLTSMVQIPHG